MQDKSQNSSALKIPALTFLRTALESTDPSVWQKHLQVLAPAVFATVGERYYKVTAQGLRVTERLIFVIRPTTQAQTSGGSSVSFPPSINMSASDSKADLLSVTCQGCLWVRRVLGTAACPCCANPVGTYCQCLLQRCLLQLPAAMGKTMQN